MSIAWKRIGYGVLFTAISVPAGKYGQPLIHDNQDAVGIIVSAFSILAGFLITIMTILGDLSFLNGKNWREDQVKKSNFYRQLEQHKLLFYVYLAVLGLIFVTTLVRKSYPNCEWLPYMEMVYLGLSCFGFLQSIRLPGELMRIHLSRFDEVVESKKKPDK